MQDEAVKNLLEELRDSKRKVQALKYALEDSIAEAAKELEDSKKE